MPWRPSYLALRTFASAPRAVALRISSRTLSTTPDVPSSIASILALPTGPDQPAKSIEVIGHVRTVRNQKRHAFVELGDGTTTASLQALLEPAQATG